MGTIPGKARNLRIDLEIALGNAGRRSHLAAAVLRLVEALGERVSDLVAGHDRNAIRQVDLHGVSRGW
ncbi:hypothetical protein G3O06_02675 [Burkholderia sp. Ac-20345]|uniref:hypothetical protein n=1 Tax=Burkholderia sp. Ac-20345 TaxID=2703891 RepID=UPI00197BB485|nr:hypothetical protein [Burkholderia sp. Ac-20345]MBN3776469.1 hypothetical protein [Burkholderia sp. Ac-20345]